MDIRALEHEFPDAFVARGRRYQAEGRVLSYDTTRDRSAICSRVRGSGGQVYECLITLDRDSFGVDVNGKCSCPVAFNCKHVVATLLEVSPAPAVESSLDELAGAGDGLRHATQSWLRDFDAAVVQSGVPDPQKSSVFYLLELSDRVNGRRLLVNLVKARSPTSGVTGTAQRYSLPTEPSSAQFLTDTDHIVFALLRAGVSEFAPREIFLRGALGANALVAMLETGRAYWRVLDGPPLYRAEARSGQLHWQLGDDAQLRIAPDETNAMCHLLPVAPPWYVDTASGACGLFETELPPAAAGMLVGAPPVQLDEVADISAHLQRQAPRIRLPIPKPPVFTDIAVLPTPRLRLESMDVNYLAPPKWKNSYFEPDWIDVASLSFDYDGHRVSPLDPSASITIRDGDAVIRIPRDRARESSATKQLQALGMQIEVSRPTQEGAALIFASDPVTNWLEFVERRLPELREQGWEVEFDDGFRFQLVEMDAWYGEINTSDRGWFDLELGVEVEGQRINLLPVMAGLIRNTNGAGELDKLLSGAGTGSTLVTLADGQLLKIPAERLRPILGTLVELFQQDPLGLDGRLRFDDAQAVVLPYLEAEDAALEWRGGEALRRSAARLRDFDGIARVDPPRTLQGTLRPYQRIGLDWLQFLRKFELNGILADDMGLGKTIQVLAHLLVEKAAGRADRPSMVVAPTSLMLNWRREAQQFAPSLRVLTLHGAERWTQFRQIDDYDLVLTTYPLLPRDKDTLLDHQYHLLVLDEAQFIKNPRTIAAQTACEIDARHRVCLTGTPMENHLGELWSLFRFLMPGLLGSSQYFRRTFRTPIERHADADRRDALRRRISPFLLRREKSVVLSELPPKTEILQEVALEGAQRDLYETLRLTMHERVRNEIARRGFARSGIILLDALLKLRQVCCDPRLVKLEAARRVKRSAKMELLETMLPSLIEEGRRILLFSQFTSMLKLIEDHARKSGIDYVKLTGSTRDRATPIDRFQSGEVPLFLISLKAGGAGLNLTAADTVIHYDPWWNPAVERQATDRAHRIGQDKPVFVYKLIAAGTVEQKIAELQAEKQGLADAILADGGQAGKVLTPELVEALFAPTL